MINYDLDNWPLSFLHRNYTLLHRNSRCCRNALLFLTGVGRSIGHVPHVNALQSSDRLSVAQMTSSRLALFLFIYPFLNWVKIRAIRGSRIHDILLRLPNCNLRRQGSGLLYDDDTCKCNPLRFFLDLMSNSNITIPNLIWIAANDIENYKSTLIMKRIWMNFK